LSKNRAVAVSREAWSNQDEINSRERGPRRIDKKGLDDRVGKKRLVSRLFSARDGAAALQTPKPGSEYSKLTRKHSLRKLGESRRPF